MNKIVLNIILFLGLGFAAIGQSSLSFYHLGNSTFQNSHLNPALIPEGKVHIGLPILSGIHFNINNKFSYDDFIVEGETQKEYDLNLFLSKIQKNNMTSISADFTLFHLGLVSRKGNMFSLFANERIEADLLYEKSLLQFAIEGNGNYLGETIKIGKTRMSSTYFREIGIGYTMNVPKSKMTVGIRAKYLMGIVNASTDPRFTADLITDPVDYSLDLDLHNATLRTSGFGVIKGETGNLATHMINNNNRGAALDFGFSISPDKNLTISGSLLDLGFISWKDDIKNHTIADTSMVYKGINLKKPKYLEETIQDTLIDKFKNRRTENYDPYTTILNPKLYLSGAYRVPTGGEVLGTYGARYVQGQTKMLFGVGYRHYVGNWLTASLNVTKLPQQFLDLGAALVFKGGPAQFFIAADQLVIYDLTKFDSFDFRVGLTFAFGKNQRDPMHANQSGPRSGKAGSSQSFLGNRVKVRGQEGIYTVIKRQNRRNQDDLEYLGDPMPHKNPNVVDVLSSTTRMPSENPNQKEVLSLPPVKPSKNRNLKNVASASGKRRPNWNRNLENVASATPNREAGWKNSQGNAVSDTQSRTKGWNKSGGGALSDTQSRTKGWNKRQGGVVSDTQSRTKGWNKRQGGSAISDTQSRSKGWSKKTRGSSSASASRIPSGGSKQKGGFSSSAPIPRESNKKKVRTPKNKDRSGKKLRKPF